MFIWPISREKLAVLVRALPGRAGVALGPAGRLALDSGPYSSRAVRTRVGYSASAGPCLRVWAEPSAWSAEATWPEKLSTQGRTLLGQHLNFSNQSGLFPGPRSAIHFPSGRALQGPILVF